MPQYAAGGESGPAIVPNKPDESLLISALKYESNEMPPSGKLPDAVINDFEKWIAIGAPDPRTDAMPKADAAKTEAKPIPRDHWAYKRPQKYAPPQVAHAAAARNDIDRFVLAKLEAAKLSPSPQAPPARLLRRLYYDLTGLPPTAEELDEFAADPSDARYEATVDRLLASPRFGERWARYWLDVARYADTKGYVFQEDRNYKGGLRLSRLGHRQLQRRSTVRQIHRRPNCGRSDRRPILCSRRPAFSRSAVGF